MTITHNTQTFLTGDTYAINVDKKKAVIRLINSTDYAMPIRTLEACRELRAMMDALAPYLS